MLRYSYNDIFTTMIPRTSTDRGQILV